MSKMVSFRFPEELLERVDRAAGKGNRTRWILGALEEAVLQQAIRTAGEELKAQPPRTIPCEEVKAMVLRCPSSGCDFQAPSPNARCPRHGRRVR